MEAKSISIFNSDIQASFLTIAIPTYKRGAFLSEAIQSALKQIDLEVSYDIMVVDNNPERGDVTEQLMEQFREDPKVSYYKNVENIGIIGNFNQLYELAKGKYVAMLHDDDLLYEHFLSVVYMILKESKFKYFFIYPSLNYSKNRDVSEIQSFQKIEYYVYKKQDFLVAPNGIPSGVVIEKKTFRSIGPFTDEYYPISDIFFNFKAVSLCKGCRVVYPNTMLYYIGSQNFSCSPEIAKSFVLMTDKLSRDYKKLLRFPWSIYSIFTRRDYVNGMMRWWANFIDEKVLEELMTNIGWKKDALRDKFSSRFRTYLARYIIIVRKRVIILNK